MGDLQAMIDKYNVLGLRVDEAGELKSDQHQKYSARRETNRVRKLNRAPGNAYLAGSVDVTLVGLVLSKPASTASKVGLLRQSMRTVPLFVSMIPSIHGINRT